MQEIIKYKPACCKDQVFDTAAEAEQHERECRHNRGCSTCRFTCRRYDRDTGEEVILPPPKETRFGMIYILLCPFWDYLPQPAQRAK